MPLPRPLLLFSPESVAHRFTPHSLSGWFSTDSPKRPRTCIARPDDGAMKPHGNPLHRLLGSLFHCVGSPRSIAALLVCGLLCGYGAWCDGAGPPLIVAWSRGSPSAPAQAVPVVSFGSPGSGRSGKSDRSGRSDRSGGSDTAASGVPDGTWIPPFGLPLTITEPFRAPAHKYGPGHRGIDIAASPGEAVASPVDGTVSFAGEVAGRPVVTVRSPDGALFSLEPVADTPPVGAAISAGDLLGVVSSGGHCDGGCVHLGVRVNGEYVDPMLRYLGRPRLLPW